MYLRATSTSLSPLRFFVVCAVLLIGVVEVGYGQDQRRVYATNQQINEGLLTSVDNAGRAVDTDPRTHSTINRLLGVGGLITVTQFLEFDAAQPAGKPVTVKLTFPSSILALIGGVEIQPFTNLREVFLSGWQANAAGRSYAGTNLVGLLNGAGDMEITIVPQTNGGTPVAYEGIWVRLQGVAVGQSLDLFHAYILEEATLGCDEKDEVIDVLSGVRAGTVVGGIANATGLVADPWDVIDGDSTTFALMSTGAKVLSEVFHTTIFQTASRPNQVAKVILQNPGGGLLDLSLLNGFVIQPYLGSTAVGMPINESTLLSLRLLPGASDIYELIVPVAGSFDRIEIKMGGVEDIGGVLGLLNSLRIYEVSRLPELPTVSGLDVDGEFLTCMGSPAVLTATAPNGNTINWYTTPEGGTPITGGTLTTPPITGLVTYHVSSQPVGCTTESPRVPVTVDVIPLPSVTISPMPTACEGDGIAKIEFINPIENPTEYSIDWINAPGDVEDVDWVESVSTFASPIEVSIPTTTVMGEYEGILRVRNENCESEAIPFTLKILPQPGKPHLTITDVHN